MVFLIAEYSNKRLVANRALAAGTSMPWHRLSPFGWCSSPVLASFSAASSGGQLPFLLRAMANTPQPFAGNCRFASSPSRLPCGARFFPLSTAPPKKQTHPLGGFSSRRLLRKSLTPFPWGSPASPRFPLGLRPHPFSPKLSRFRAVQKPRQPRGSANLLSWWGHSAREGSLVLANFAPEASPFSKSAKMPYRREPRTGSAPNQQPFLAGFTSTRRLRKLPLRGLAVPAPLRGTVFQPSENCRFVLFTNALQLCEADIFRVLKLALRFLPMFGNGAPAPRPPINWGPVRFAPLVIHCSSNNLKRPETA